MSASDQSPIGAGASTLLDTRTGDGRTSTVPPVAEPQWRAEAFQLVNWGGFDGHAHFDFAPDSTIVTGASGAGKSTLLDAYIALMMPSDTAFNGASNAAAIGRARSSEQRNLLTYLRGKIDDTLEDGRTVDRVLRGDGSPTWGAIGMTFVSDVGDRFTAIRAYYAPARASRSSEITMRLITVEASFDLRELEQYARVGEEHFPPRQLKNANTALRTFDSYTTFAQALYTRLGIGIKGDGSKALRLLARIQAGQQIRTVDELYKQMVIERPDSYAKADAAIGYFDTLEDLYREMVTEQDRARILGPITEAHRALTSAQGEITAADTLGALEATDTPAGLWRLRKYNALLTRAVEENRSDHATRGAQFRTALEQEHALAQQLDGARREHRDAGGGLIEELGLQIASATQRVEQRRSSRVRLSEAITPLNQSLATHEDLERLHTDARAFLSGYEDAANRLTIERDRVRDGGRPLQDRLEDIRADLTSLEGRSGRVDHRLDAMRRLVSQASGIDAADLPFVAELIDFAPGEEEWQTAIETVLYPSARIMLVPLELLRDFSRSIDSLRLRGRLNFEGVDQNRPLPDNVLDPERIAGKLRYKESPYQSWVLAHIAQSSRNALCVDSAGDLDGNELRVTKAGQTRQGRSGSHGQRDSRPIIGFDNADLRAELVVAQAELESELGAIIRDANNLRDKSRQMSALRDAFTRALDFAWESIDDQSASDEQHALEVRRQAILDSNDRLNLLENQITKLEAAHEQAQALRHKLKRDIDELDRDHGALVDLEDAVHPQLRRFEDEGLIQITLALEQRLDGFWEDALDGDAEDPREFARLIARLQRRHDEATQIARNVLAQTTHQIEAIFGTYQDRWEDPNLGRTIESYQDYAEVLERIVTSGLHERRAEWRRRLMHWSGEHLQQLATALSAAIEEIEDRLDPVNQILQHLPFGATEDRLFINLRRLAPDAVVKFRRELGVHARTATKGLSDEQMETKFKDLQRFMAQIRRKDDERLPRELAPIVDRDRLLDVRRHVEITAERRSQNRDVLSTYSSLSGKSGGETQELIAFIVGAALRFQLGDQSRSRPRFAPVFLDEGFIKSDAEFASRAVLAWKGFGFQLIIGAPLDKVTSLEPHMQRVLFISKNTRTHRSYVDHIEDAIAEQPLQ